MTERHHLEDVYIHGKTILKWVLNEDNEMVWTGFTLLRISSGGNTSGFYKMLGISEFTYSWS
jgi:hypothetical protein